MSTTANVVVVIALACLAIAMVLMWTGYAILITQAVRSESTWAALRTIWRCKDYRMLHRAAGNLIYAGAGFGAVAFLTFLVGVLAV